MKHIATSCQTAMQNRVAKVVSWCNYTECYTVSAPALSCVSGSLSLSIACPLASVWAQQ